MDIPLSSQKSFSRKIITSVSQMFSGNLILTVGSFISGYFFARFLGPETYGTWQTAVVIMGYTFVFSLNIGIIMRRDYIILKKEGKTKLAQNMSDIVFTYSVVIGILVAAAIFLYAKFFPENIMFKHSLYTVTIIYLCNIFISFGNIMSKGINKYAYITWQKGIQATGLLLTVPFVYLYGYKMLLIGFALTNIFIAGFYIYVRPVKLGLYWNNSMFKKMVKDAFPLYLLGLSGVIFAGIDRLIIASMLSFVDVGLYSLSNLIANPIRLMISSTTIVLFTQLNERYGSDTGKHVVEKHLKIPQQFFSKILPPLIGMGLIALPLVVELLLPEYENGIEAAQINIFAIFFFMLTGFAGNALFVMNKQKYTAISFFIAGIIKVSLSVLLIKLGYGISGVAVATVIAYFIYNVVMVRIVFKLLNESKKDFYKFFMSNLLPVVLILLYVLMYQYLRPYVSAVITNAWMELLLIELLLAILCIPLFLSGYKLIKINLLKK